MSFKITESLHKECCPVVIIHMKESMFTVTYLRILEVWGSIVIFWFQPDRLPWT